MSEKRKGQKRPERHLIWLSHYLDPHGGTFLNATKSTIKAGYKGNYGYIRSLGSKIKRKFDKEIDEWLDEVGISERTVKERLSGLMFAKETKFFSHEGKVTDEREVEAVETQRKAVDMAAKIRGMYAPEKHAVEGNLVVEVQKFGSGENEDKDTE